MNRLIAVSALALGLVFTAMPASAAVYCKTVGVPKGCVARPASPVVYCKTVGVPKGCVARPVGAAPGASATNRNGGVNRVGVRR